MHRSSFPDLGRARTALPRLAAAAAMAASAIPLLRPAPADGWAASAILSASVLLAGASLWLLAPGGRGLARRAAGRVAAGAVLLLGGVALARGGSVAPAGALGVVAAGTALILLPSRSDAARWSSHGALLALSSLCLFSVVLSAYAGQVDVARLPWLSMRLETALVLVPILAGLVVARPADGLARLLGARGPGGQLLRLALPAAVVLPPVLGWVQLLEEAGGVYPQQTATALAVAWSVVSFAGLLVFSAAMLDRIDARSREARAAQRTSEGRVRLLLDSTAQAIYGVDRDGACSFCNAAFVELFGYAGAEEVIGCDVHQVFHHHDLDGRAAPWDACPTRRAMESGQVVHSDAESYWHRDGYRIVAESWAHPIREDGLITGAVVSLVDLTEQRRLQTELDRLFNLSHDLLCVAGADGYMKRLNPAWERTLGFTIDEIKARPFMEFVHPDDHAATAEAVEAQVERGESILSFENRYRTRDGSYRVLLWSSTPVSSTGLLYAVAHDITDRKLDEDALRQANMAAAAAIQELEAFSYSVSHDLRAPLRAIDGFSQALAEDYAGVLDADGKGLLDRVRRAAQRMSELIEDLLKLSRISRTTLHREPVDLSQMAAGIVADLRAREPFRDARVEIATGLVAHGDAGLLQIVLQNLMDNAWKYTRKVEDAEIQVGRALVSGEECFFVRDNGAGFDMAHADKLFGAFQRLHRAEDFEGTGVGLATVQRVIRLHGGRVWAESEPDEGASFYFTIGKGGHKRR